MILASRVPLFSGVTLVVASAVITSLASSAYAANLEGFGCEGNYSCQTYIEFGGNSFVYNGIRPLDTQSLPFGRLALSSLGINVEAVGSGQDPVFLNPRAPEPYFVSVSGSAEVAGVASPGQIGFAASAVARSEMVTIEGNSGETFEYFSPVGAGTDASLTWGDILTITAPNLPVGTLVPFQLGLKLDSILGAEGVPSGIGYVGHASTVANLRLQNVLEDGSFTYLTGLGLGADARYQSEITSQFVEILLSVGSKISFEGSLNINASTGTTWEDFLTDPVTGESRARASSTANYYLTPLSSRAGYNSASGATYFYSSDTVSVPTPALMPGLIGLGWRIWQKRRNETSEQPNPTSM